jgi:hypothetical protein
LHLRRKPKGWVLFVSHSFLSVNFDWAPTHTHTHTHTHVCI